jgi:hypothetical protein
MAERLISSADAPVDLALANVALNRAAVHAQLAQAVVMARIAKALERIADQGKTITEDEQLAQVHGIIRSASRITHGSRCQCTPCRAFYDPHPAEEPDAAAVQLPDEPPERPVDDGLPACLCSHSRSAHMRDNTLADDWRRGCLTPGCGCHLYRTQEAPAAAVPPAVVRVEPEAEVTATDLPAIVRPYLDATGPARLMS